jgi:hypothetical protein
LIQHDAEHDGVDPPAESVVKRRNASTKRIGCGFSLTLHVKQLSFTTATGELIWYKSIRFKPCSSLTDEAITQCGRSISFVAFR